MKVTIQIDVDGNGSAACQNVLRKIQQFESYLKDASKILRASTGIFQTATDDHYGKLQTQAEES